MNDEQLLPIGTILQSRYRVERQLASGGFGNTYEVTNINFDERWAMKEFFMKSISEREGNTTSVHVSSASKSQFESQRDKFNKEARRLRKLRHPGIVHVEDLFDDNNTSYYIMDYIGGGSLAETIKRHGPLSEKRVKELLPQLLDALEYVHNQKIWHLDLKPGNILLNDDGTPVIIDFGASKQLGLGGAHSTSLGMTYTQGYAPSEQVDQNLDRIGSWTDLYALGATLYNLITNDTPPMVSEIQESEAAAFNFPNGTSEQMKKLILWMMNPNRRKRPQSVKEVRNFLASSSSNPSPQKKDEQDIGETVLPDTNVQKPADKGEEGKSILVPWYKKPATIVAAVITVIALLTIMVWPRSETPDEGTSNKQGSSMSNEPGADIATTTTDLAVKSSIGEYRYTGPINAAGEPDGIGTATFSDGRRYSGPFVAGTMQGTNATFIMSNGDVFKGEFRQDHFYQGRYTIKSDDSYFEGTFKDGQPDVGAWYDKNGNKL